MCPKQNVFTLISPTFFLSRPSVSLCDRQKALGMTDNKTNMQNIMCLKINYLPQNRFKDTKSLKDRPRSG